MFASLRDSKSGVEKSRQFWLRVCGPPLFPAVIIDLASGGTAYSSLQLPPQSGRDNMLCLTGKAHTREARIA